MQTAQINYLLDLARDKALLKNDAALSRTLKVAPPVISKLRHGTLPVGASIILSLHENIGMAVAEIRRILADEVES